MSKTKTLDFVKKYTMIIVLILVIGLFAVATKGTILLPMNVSSLISQNAYVFILATGMLLCILTGGNIDLSVGSVVCFTGAVGATLMVTYKVPWYLAVVIMLIVGILIGAFHNRCVHSHGQAFMEPHSGGHRHHHSHILREERISSDGDIHSGEVCKQQSVGYHQLHARRVFKPSL